MNEISQTHPHQEDAHDRSFAELAEALMPVAKEIYDNGPTEELRDLTLPTLETLESIRSSTLADLRELRKSGAGGDFLSPISLLAHLVKTGGTIKCILEGISDQTEAYPMAYRQDVLAIYNGNSKEREWQRGGIESDLEKLAGLDDTLKELGLNQTDNNVEE